MPRGAKGDKVALFTALEATIQDPTGKYDNLKVFDRWFSTMFNRDGIDEGLDLALEARRGDPGAVQPQGPDGLAGEQAGVGTRSDHRHPVGSEL
jgi:hypothetical protein